MELKTIHINNKICTQRKKVRCTLVTTKCRKAEEKETECPNFDRDAADKLSLSLILKTDPFVPVTE